MKSSKIASIFTLCCMGLILYSCGGGSESNQNNSNDVGSDNITQVSFFGPSMEVDTINRRNLSSLCENQTLHEDYHLIFNPVDNNTDFGITGIALCTIILELPDSVTLHSVDVKKAYNDALNAYVLVYDIFVKDTNYYTNDHLIMFNVETIKSQFDSCQYIMGQITKDAVVEKTVFLTNTDSLSISKNADTLITRFDRNQINLDYLSYACHNQSNDNFLIYADAPDSLSYSQGQDSAYIKIAINLPKKTRIDSVYVSNVAHNRNDYLSFNVISKTDLSINENRIAIFDINIAKTDYDSIDYYLIRVYDSNGKEKKKKVLNAQTNGVPFIP